ncbi:conserved hypothetical protein [Listeria marthii FSL S4-120]|uniref:Uncharacterized protein n=1 Tax=Listeria marthii FSL S4-120 TaxID=702457 RepID=A0ABN0C045_9LIST|nr:conserved hypothetical protein [Listeria marthii FSL S4-120]
MKKENEVLSSVSFEKAKRVLKLKDIYEAMKGDKKQSFSIELKKNNPVARISISSLNGM